MHRPGLMSPVNSKEISGKSVGPGVSVAVTEAAVVAAGRVGVVVAARAVEAGDGAGAVEVRGGTGAVSPPGRRPHPVTASTASPSHSLFGISAGLFDSPHSINKRNFDCEVLDNSDVLRYYF